MPRVVGTDPGTSSLDVLLLEDGRVQAQRRFSPAELRASVEDVVSWLHAQGSLHLIAGPSGYGVSLVYRNDCTQRDLDLMTLVRPDERGHDQGVRGFSRLLRALCATNLPVVFLPGAIHLPTVPRHRKLNRIDLGTPDKLCVAALALERAAAAHAGDSTRCTFCLVELGSAFTACLVVRGGEVVDGMGGTSGPLGWQSAGLWDGEVAYWRSALRKEDLFRGGVQSFAGTDDARLLFRESLRKAVAGLQAVTPFDEIVISGRLLEIEEKFAELVVSDLSSLGRVIRLQSLPGAWVKHAAQGSALLADGLAGGTYRPLVEHLHLREAAGSSLDYLAP